MKKILMVDDDKEYRDIVVSALTQEGFTVFVADDGGQGVVMAEKQQIDLILLDILMPKVDGVTFFNRLENVLKKHIPVIILTNLTEVAVYHADIKDVLIKSNVSIEEIIKKVKENIN